MRTGFRAFLDIEALGEATRRRVDEAVAALTYRPDTAGRGLRSARQLSVGMIVVDESPRYLSDGSTTQVVSGLGNVLNAAGYTLQLEGLRARDLERSSLLDRFARDGTLTFALLPQVMN